MHTARLPDHIKDPAVVQSINLLQHVALQLNEKDRMPSLSRSQGHAGPSRTTDGRPRTWEGNAQNNQDQQIIQGNQNQLPVEPAHSATGGGRGNQCQQQPPQPRGNYQRLQDAPSVDLRNYGAIGYGTRQIINTQQEARALQKGYRAPSDAD